MSQETWLQVEAGSDFTINNLPYGIFSIKDKAPRAGVALGTYIIDLAELEAAGVFGDISTITLFNHPTLNTFMEQDHTVWKAVRARLTELLTTSSELKENASLREVAIVSQADATMHMPANVGDYTDFYSSREHATNVGIMFRGKENALMPNWLHLPVAYHGRASSIILSGVDIPRPKGQTNNDMTTPKFEASARVDIELEMGFFYGGKSNALGESISIENAHKHIFGMVLVNDWSARDIQKWEYQPLGPFLSKSFATSISPWVVPMEALEPYRVPSPKKEKDLLPYLQETGNNSYDIHLEVYLQTETLDEPFKICKSNHKHLYWSIFQHVAHHTVNGCTMNAGDLVASGTISGPTEDSYGSLLELAWKGDKPIELPNGEKRVFLKDGDTITIKGYCEKDGIRVGFGEVKTKILPAK